MKRKFHALIAALSIIVCFVSCKKERSNESHPHISKVEAESFNGENIISINGTDFGSSADKVNASFNGVKGTVRSISDDQIVLGIPGKMTSGTLNLAINGFPTPPQPINFYLHSEVVLVAGAEKRGWADGLGAAARFDVVGGIVSDAEGNLYFSDVYNHRICKVTKEGLVTTFAGGNGNGYKNGPAKDAQFYLPKGLAIDPSKPGRIYVADDNHCIRYIENGNVFHYAGTPRVGGFDEGLLNGVYSRFYYPNSICFLRDTLFVSDEMNHRIRYIAKTNIDRDGTLYQAYQVGTYAGNGTYYYYDVPQQGSLRNVAVTHPGALAYDNQGNLYFHSFYRIMKISGNYLSSFVGNGSGGYVDGPAQTAQLSSVRAMTFGPTGVLYFAANDGHARHQTVRVFEGGRVKTYAGQSSNGFRQGPLDQAKFYFVGAALHFDNSGTLYIGDYTSIRKVVRTIRRLPN